MPPIGDLSEASQPSGAGGKLAHEASTMASPGGEDRARRDEASKSDAGLIDTISWADTVLGLLEILARIQG